MILTTALSLNLLPIANRSVYKIHNKYPAAAPPGMTKVVFNFLNANVTAILATR